MVKGLQCCDVVHGKTLLELHPGREQTPKRCAIGHTHARASREHVCEPLASSSAKSCHRTSPVHDEMDAAVDNNCVIDVLQCCDCDMIHGITLSMNAHSRERALLFYRLYTGL
jgi:hypothetical protein